MIIAYDYLKNMFLISCNISLENDIVNYDVQKSYKTWEMG